MGVAAGGGPNGVTGGGGGRRICGSGVGFWVGFFVVYGFIAALYAWVVLRPFSSAAYARSGLPWLGCQQDNEGSWAIGVYYGDSPFSLKPIETLNLWNNESAAWPIANPVITCASASDSGFVSNFVADPFLYVQDDTYYVFYETKNSYTLQGDIGVAKSTDKGATWQQLGIALDEEWHLSYPYVFDYLGQIYMMPESSEKGDLRLYRATNFPLEWKLEKVIMKKPMVDSFILNHDGEYYLFGSDHSSFGSQKNGQLEIWYSSSPLGPWTPHNKNPIHNAHRSSGARNGGRPFVYDRNIYRVGQDCGETYGRRIRVFKVDVLTKQEYKEVEVPFILDEPNKGRNTWNGARYHHLDVQQLSSGQWVGVMDGDRVPSGDISHRVILGCIFVAAVVGIVVLLGVLLGVVNCIIPLNWCADYSGKRSDTLLSWERADLFSSKVRRFCSRLNRVPSLIRGRIKLNTFVGRLVLALIFAFGVGLMCLGVHKIYGGNGADEPYPWKGQFSQFTLLTMTYDARLWNLKMYVKHYSRCASVKEMVVVWNKGTPPDLDDLDSAVPVRIRREDENSLNNRFKLDPLIQTRAVLELDDDIMMSCDDIERGFKVWRQYPDRIVGFYPRYVDPRVSKYRAEKYARKHNGYNMILTGAAFIDSQVAFGRYWGEGAKEGREFVDKNFNCEDVLLNFLYANASSAKTVEYVKPAWTIDTSKLSSVAISRNTQAHFQVRSECLVKFTEMYGGPGDRKWGFNGRRDGWDV